MAVTRFGVGDANTVKIWSKIVEAEALKETFYARFTGTSSTALAHQKTEIGRDKGDEVKFNLRTLLTGRGVGEGSVLEGNEESLSLYQDSVKLGQLRHATRFQSPKTIDAQRVLIDMRKESKDGLVDWVPERLDTVFFNHTCGFTPANTESATSGMIYTGGNTVLAPSTNRIIRAKGLSTDQAVGGDNTAKFTLNLIDQAVLKARTASPMIRPVRVNGADWYVVFIHESQAYDLRSDTATAGNWFDLQKARLQGGEGDDNGIFKGAMGTYNGCVIHVSNRVTQGVHSTTGAAVSNTRRAVLCGQQSLAVAFGADTTKSKFSWTEKEFDYDEQIGIAVRLLYGMKKTRYNGEDYGVITITAYSSQ